VRITAFAKLNLSLRVSSAGADGYHPVRGLFQSISLADVVTVVDADQDSIVVSGGWAPEDESNLAWQAVAAVRTVGANGGPVALTIDKAIPSAAGLGGASADAAAALIAAGSVLRVSHDELRTIGPRLGSDVPFAMVGGTALVAGLGEQVAPQPALTGFAVALVVPPLELETARVYRAWDELGEPRGPSVAGADVPPALRGYTPLHNDLYPAAVAVAPQIEEWRAELAERWGAPVMMTGSGSALFTLFPTEDEAAGAADDVPVGARFAAACNPVDRGWQEE